jgi:hypothetical protein
MQYPRHLIVFCAAVVLATAAGPKPQPALAAAPSPTPGALAADVLLPFIAGVADPGHDVAFVRSPAMGIDALRLADGHLLWHSPANPNFLALYGDNLLVWTAPPATRANVLLGLATLNVHDGTEHALPAEVRLPRWVPLGQFSRCATWVCTGAITGTVLRCSWVAQTWVEGAITRSMRQNEIRDRTHEAEGSFTLDLASGRLQAKQQEHDGDYPIQSASRGQEGQRQLGQRALRTLTAQTQWTDTASINSRQFREGWDGQKNTVVCTQNGKVVWSRPVSPSPQMGGPLP